MKELNSLKKSSREAVKAAEAEKDNALKEAQTERDNAVKEAVAKYETALSKAKAEAEEADHAKAELEKKLKSGNTNEARVALKIIFENVQKGLTEFIEKSMILKTRRPRKSLSLSQASGSDRRLMTLRGNVWKAGHR